MKHNANLIFGAILLLVVPSVQPSHEMEDDSQVSTTNNNDLVRNERNDLKQQLARARNLPEHNWVYRSNPIEKGTSETSRDQVEQTHVKFAEKTWSQKISNFFSNIFGNKAIIDNRFLTHNMKTSNQERTEDALTQDRDKTLFKSLSEEQQEKSLNQWLKVERNKLEIQQISERKAYEGFLKKLDQTKNDVTKINITLITASNDAGDKISALLKKFKTDYPDTNATTLTQLMQVNNSILAPKNRDFSTNPDKQTILLGATNKLQTLFQEKESALTSSMLHVTAKTKEQVTKELKAIKSDRAILQKSLDTIHRNYEEIRTNRDRLNSLQETIETNNIRRQLNMQNEFNHRMIHFRNEIQRLLPTNRELKYNQTSGKFEYHTIAARSTIEPTIPEASLRQPTDYQQDSTNNKSTLSHLTENSSPEEIQQRFKLGLQEFHNLTSSEKDEALKGMLVDYKNINDAFQKAFAFQFLKSIQNDVPKNLQNEYNAIVYPNDQTHHAIQTENKSFSGESNQSDNYTPKFNDIFSSLMN